MTEPQKSQETTTGAQEALETPGAGGSSGAKKGGAKKVLFFALALALVPAYLFVIDPTLKIALSEDIFVEEFQKAVKANKALKLQYMALFQEEPKYDRQIARLITDSIAANHLSTVAFLMERYADDIGANVLSTSFMMAGQSDEMRALLVSHGADEKQFEQYRQQQEAWAAQEAKEREIRCHPMMTE